MQIADEHLETNVEAPDMTNSYTRELGSTLLLLLAGCSLDTEGHTQQECLRAMHRAASAVVVAPVRHVGSDKYQQAQQALGKAIHGCPSDVYPIEIPMLGKFSAEELTVMAASSPMSAEALKKLQTEAPVEELAHVAARFSTPEVLSQLLDTGVSMMTRSADGQTLPMSAVGGVHSVRMLELLGARGADLWAQDPNGNTAAHHAIVEQDKEALEFLARTLPCDEGPTRQFVRLVEFAVTGNDHDAVAALDALQAQRATRCGN